MKKLIGFIIFLLWFVGFSFALDFSFSPTSMAVQSVIANTVWQKFYILWDSTVIFSWFSFNVVGPDNRCTAWQLLSWSTVLSSWIILSTGDNVHSVGNISLTRWLYYLKFYNSWWWTCWIPRWSITDYLSWFISFTRWFYNDSPLNFYYWPQTYYFSWQTQYNINQCYVNIHSNLWVDTFTGTNIYLEGSYAYEKVSSGSDIRYIHSDYNWLTWIYITWQNYADNAVYTDFYNKTNIYLSWYHTKTYTWWASNYWVMTPPPWCNESPGVPFTWFDFSLLSYDFTGEVLTGNQFEIFYTQWRKYFMLQYKTWVYVGFIIILLWLLAKIFLTIKKKW